MADLLTAKEVKSYLGIDYEDTAVSAQLERMKNTADRYLCGSVGDKYPLKSQRSGVNNYIRPLRKQRITDVRRQYKKAC